MRSEKILARDKRKKRIKGKIRGTAQRPRMVVFKSAAHIYVQAVNDIESDTLAASSTADKDLMSKVKGKSSLDSAKIVGADIAEKLKKLKVDSVVFDRNGYLYHGKIKALADASREAGIKF